MTLFFLFKINLSLKNLFTCFQILKVHNFDAFTIDLKYISGKFNSDIHNFKKMFKNKYKQFKSSLNKSNLEQVLWFIENYLPQKKDRDVQKKIYLDNLEAETIKKFSKLASIRSKNLWPTTKNTTISFTFGNWALPYLKLLKKIGIAK